MTKLCNFGKEIKKRLVDIDKNQEWLITEVRADTGLYFYIIRQIMSHKQY